MSEGAIIEFGEILDKKIVQNRSISTIWATVKTVDWDAKTMIAIGLVDDLEYYDVLLGIGSIARKPKVGTKCLLGVIGGKEASTFLIECEEFEEIVFQSNNTQVTISQDGTSISKGNESLISILSDWIDEVSKIVVIQGNTINVAAMQAIKQRLNTILK